MIVKLGKSGKERTKGHDPNVVLGAVFHQLFALCINEGVHFHLIDNRHGTTGVGNGLEVRNAKIADSNRFGLAIFPQRNQGIPGFHDLSFIWTVNEKEIHIVHLQRLFQGFVQRFVGFSKAMLLLV